MSEWYDWCKANHVCYCCGKVRADEGYTTFILAVDRHWIKEDSQQPSADFIPVIAWGKLAEIVGNNMTKGRRISVDGRRGSHSALPGMQIF